MLECFAERRRAAIAAMGQGVLVVFAAPTALRNNDVEHEYRQDSDFYYLTGIDEPGCALVLGATPEQPFVLFVRPRDPERETWDGERIGIEGAINRFGANGAFAIDEFESKLRELLKGKARLYYAIGRDQRSDDIVLRALAHLRERGRRGDTGPVEIVEPSTVLHELRLIKSADEVGHLRRAIDITRSGHEALFAQTRPQATENQLEGILRERFRTNGSERCAYPPIVASGRNARVLHHRRNDRVIGDGELVLVDAGAEFEYMAADITRTFPSNGRFTDLQRRAYEIVLRAQERAISEVKPGSTLEEVHQAAVIELIAGLRDLEIISGTDAEILKAESYKKYYMHRTSHWLGMDVHDVGAYFRDGKPRPLSPGMVLTVEPGLYFGPDDPAVPEGLRDVGIRIEDDILVTHSGSENLSASIPKTVREIELAMARST
jgi:Xaa-Pro aminopeptidase